MIRIAVVLCLVAAATANTCCSAGDMKKVADSWNALWNTADSATTKVIFGREIFHRLLEKFPDAKGMFSRVNVDDMESPEFAAHTLRVLNGLDLFINLLSEDDALHAQIEHLNTQHLNYDGMKADYLWGMLDILTHALPSVLDGYDALSFKNCFNHVFHDYTKGLP